MGDRVLHGLLPGDSSSIFLFSSSDYDERWAKAELITAELIGRIQPSKTSEELRKAVINYVERVIERDLDCKVFPFGSVPLKTYLPNGDIDLTAFSTFHHLNDTWANDLCAILENEERSHSAGFQVKEVKLIHAEVPVVKCLVENIIVDISFNQLGGLSTLCFLERVDRLIGHDHLFKQSIILVKAWCFYESRILGAHHGLLSTYALETLVLYIFHVFHGSLRGPLEVLFRFLEFFSKFDWNQYCLSLSGPIPLVSLHNMAADLPQKQCDLFLLSKAFLDTCRQEYSVSPGSQGTQGKAFSQKFMNVIDPLRSSNNLGRSVNKGNFVRIHSAFAYGAGQLEKLFQSPQEHLAENLVAFFRNTERHCRRRHPEAPVLGLKDFQVQFDALSCGDKDRSKDPNIQMKGLRRCTVAPMSTNPHCDLTCIEASIVPNGFPDICDSDENDSTWSTAEEESGGHKTSSKALEKKVKCAAVVEESKAQILQNGQPSVLCSNGPVKDRDGGSNHGSIRGRNSVKLVDLRAGPPLDVRETQSQEQQLEESIQEARSIMWKEMDHNHHLANYNNRCFDDEGDCATDLQKSEVGHCQLLEARDTEADILRGDFAIHLQNLEAGRCFQTSRLHGPLSSAVSSISHTRYTEEGSTWEGPGRPGTLNTSLSTQVSGRRNGVLPASAGHEAHFQNSCALRSGIYGEGLPKFHRGTGTFFPNVNPAFDRDRRLTSIARGQRGATSLDFRDPFNHNGAPPFRPRYNGQKKRDGSHKSKNKVEKDKMDLKVGANDWDILKEDSGHADVSVLSSGNSKAFQIGKVEFGSFGPVGYPAGGFQSVPVEQENVESALQNQHTAHDGERSRSCEAVASVGHHVGRHQSLSEGSYQLKEEDFPPLNFGTQRERPSVFASQKS